MAPGGGGKRKRGDRTFSQDSGHEGSRPSPHHPGNLSLAQHSNSNSGQPQYGYGREQNDQRGGGRRRASRGGRGNGSQRSPINSPNAIPLTSRISKAPSPPATPTPARNESEQAATIASSPPLSTAATQTSYPQRPPAPLYPYEHVTDVRLNQWTREGRSATIDVGLKAKGDQDFVVLISLFQELIRSGVDGRMEPEEAGGTIKAIIEAAPAQDQGDTSGDSYGGTDTSSTFLDCLSIVAETSTVGPQWPPLLIATGISPLLMRQQLDSSLLENLGMIRSTFVRVGIRQQTNLLYRQSNYNLLREETEGYSKLITELFTTSSNETSSLAVVEETFERVKGMIGAFDLDVGRVLDVTLDVFAAVLVKHYRFFVKYLRASSWWPKEHTSRSGTNGSASGSLPRWALPCSQSHPMSSEEEDAMISAKEERDKVFWMRAKQKGIAAFFELGDRRKEESELQAAVAKRAEADPSDQDEDQQWIEATGTLPPPGNRVAAQILGFKLRFYSSVARSPNDILPVNLIYLAALLIKIGFISLRDLYPHLWPADGSMTAVREEKTKEKAEKERLNRPGGGAPNALTSAGALPDDMPPSTRLRESDKLREAEASRNTPVRADAAAEKTASTAPVEDKEELPEPSDQKVQLLKSLLCIGALPEALYILGRFPWLPDVFPELPEYIHRILHHSLSKVYAPVRPLHEYPELKAQRKEPDSDQSGIIKGYLKVVDAPPRKVLRWAQLDKDDTNEAIDYRFYWDDWADNVPVCQSVDDVFILCSTILNYTGVKIGQDPGLLLKIARIGNHSLNTDFSEANKARWVDLSKRLIVPALSLTNRLPGVVNEVFDLIKNFSTMTRYSIYAEWYQGPTSRLPDIKSAFEAVKAETKDVLKRISKTNVKPMARSLARIAYSSPGIVFQVAIAQIESYDNLVETVVECARYFTYLSYDVLTWSILSSLGGPGRVRVQQDGMLTSRWLSALSLFAGKVFRRYSVMNPTPILQYVAEQLRQSNPTDLIVLEQITSSMAGIVSDTNFNQIQVEAMSGGELLQAQTMLQLLDRRHESKTTAKRLLQALTRPRLAGQLLILIAQERQTCVFKIPEHNSHLKLLGNLFDELHRVFVQYLDLLRTNLTIEEFDELVPNVSRLMIDFGIDPSVAFAIARPSISAAMSAYDAAKRKVLSESKKPQVQDHADSPDKVDDAAPNGEIKPEIETIAIPSEPVEGDQSQQSEIHAVEAMEVDSVEESSAEVADSVPPIDNSTKPQNHPVLQDIIDQIAPSLPEETWDILSRPFYVTFWSLSLGDMSVPGKMYEAEMKRQDKKIAAINSDRSDLSVLGTQRKEREKKALVDLRIRLREEFRAHLGTYSAQRTRLMQQKDQWFQKQAPNSTLLEQCFLPRILLSPIDAMYSFKMFKFLHSSGAAHFWSLGFLAQIFAEKRLTSILFLCTAKEAEHFGRFLNEILDTLKNWHGNKTTYEREAHGPKKELTGFFHKQDNGVLGFLPYEGFRSLLFKWHRKLHIAFKICFAGGEYMHIRNAINVLKAVHQAFPAIDWMGHQLVNSITGLSKTETREDLKIAATSLLGNLKRREKDWVLQNAFGAVGLKASNTPNGHRSTSAKPSAPQTVDAGAKDLNPRAAEFQPKQRLSTDGTTESVKHDAGKAPLDAEDGEIDDARLADAAKNVEKVVSQNGQPMNGNSNVVSQPTPLPIVSENLPPRDATPRSQTPKPMALESNKPSREELASQAIPPTQDAKSSSSAAGGTLSLVPSRPEAPRSISSNAVNGHVLHGLPSKPDPPFPKVGELRVADRERGSRDQTRDSHYHSRNGIDGSRDPMSDRVPERQAHSTQQRSYERPERLHTTDRERGQVSWGADRGLPSHTNLQERHSASLQSREPQHSTRSDRNERSQRDWGPTQASSSSRAFESPGQTSRDSAMAPPRSTIPQHPDRAALIQNSAERDRPSFDGQNQDRRQEGRRYEGQSVSERSSRPSSPHRLDDRRQTRAEPRRDDRPPIEVRQAPDNLTNGRLSRYEDSRFPSGPRTDRPVLGSQGSPQDRFRDSTRNAPGPSPQNEQYRRDQNVDHSNRHQESQYGRLNTGPEIPSGPRLPNGNLLPSQRPIGRNVSAPHHLNTQHTQPQTVMQNTSTTTQERQTPTGPSSRGPPRPPNRLETIQSAPPTPATESPDTAGVHPDRLRAIQGVAGVPPVSAAQTTSGVGRPHREPVAPISVQPTPGQRPNSQIPSPGGPLPSPGASMQGPIAPSPTSRGPPTGPSFNNDRSRGEKRMFAGLQNTLHQAGTLNPPERSSQGASIRGRGGRANNPPFPSPSASGPPTPVASGPSQDAFPGRGDLFSNRPQSMQQHAEVEADFNRGPRRVNGREPSRELPRDTGRDGIFGRVSGRDDARDDERRQGHHRSSRDHSRDDGLPPPMPSRDEDRLPRRNDLRDHGRPPMPPPAERDMRRPPRMDEQRRAESDRRDMEGWNAERRNGMERRDDRDRRDMGGSGRKRGRGGEEGHIENKRLRRSG